MPRFQKWTGWMQDIWLALGAVILFLVVVEGLSTVVAYLNPHRPGNVDWRIYADGTRHEPWIRNYWKEFQIATTVRYIPYLEWTNRPYQGKYFHSDRDGTRRTWNIVKPGKPFRIFMFGGSTMWGTGARDDGTIPSALSRLLSKKTDRPIEVVNDAQVGYVSTQEVIKLLLEIRKGNVPDLVIFYDGVNEVHSPYENHEVGVPMANTYRIRQFNLFNSLRKKEMIKEFLLAFMKDTHTFHVLDHFFHLNRFPELAGKQREQVVHELVQLYFSNLALVRKMGREEGFSSLFYWQPVIYTKRNRTPYEASQLQLEKAAEPLYLASNEEVDRAARLSGIPEFHNITHLLDDVREPLYVDCCHLTEKGDERVARRMLVDVLPVLERSKQKM